MFKLQDIKHLKEEEDKTVDLGRFMHTSPFFVQTVILDALDHLLFLSSTTNRAKPIEIWCSHH